jgi:Fe-S cluster assembly ATP-binding protein
MSELVIKDLHANIEGKEILNGLNLTLKKGEVVAIMGPNGSGKSTLANVIMGHPKYEVSSGDISVDGESIIELEADERAKKRPLLEFPIPFRDSRCDALQLLTNSNQLAS